MRVSPRLPVAPRPPVLPRLPRFKLTAPILLFIYIIGVWFLARLLQPQGGSGLWTVRIVLWLLGLAALGLLFWHRSKRDRPESELGQADEVDETIKAAEARLNESTQVAESSLNKMSVVLILGREGSTKTTTIVHSGLDAELLAGECYRGKIIAPTEGVNLWLAGGNIFVEAGGKLTTQPEKWGRLIRRLRTKRLAAVLLGRPQAPRVAVVCCSCEELYKSGAAQAVAAAARELRLRLTEASEILGIQLPVYVLFTKADKIPFFEDYTRVLTRDETQEVLGETLRLPTDDGTGTYSEREHRRVSESMRRLYRALAEKRLQILARENGRAQTGAAYEFPREFQRITDIASRFLVELCKPSQLAASPFLRGFYFTGVRPIIIDEPADGLAQNTATRVIDAGSEGTRTVAATRRKVPQWLFIERVFRDVILKDSIARGLTQRGVRVDAWRRAALVTLSVASLFVASSLFISFLSNRALLRRSIEPARELRGIIANEPDVPDISTLALLESLRGEVESLGQYDRDGRPFRFGWGLYTGARAFPAARSIYLGKIESLLVDPARDRMLDSLRRFPALPYEDSEFEPTYELLKSYLMISAQVERLDSAFLMNRLPKYWLANRRIDPAGYDLASRQFAFYSGVLCRKNQPDDAHGCGDPGDARVVERAQSFLGEFNAIDRIYPQVLQAAAGLDPVRFDVAFPRSRGLLRNGHSIPGAFTRPGWKTVMHLLSVPGRGAVDDWVLGQYAPTSDDRARLGYELRRRYESDYIAHWLTFLRAGSIAGFGNLRDAGRKLERLSDIGSPLLQMLALASEHTAVDSQVIGKAFQPLHVVVTPGTHNRYLNEVNRHYANSLIELQLAVSDAAGAGSTGERNELKTEARQRVGAVKASVAQLAQSFSIDGAANDVGDALQRLMRAPADSALRHLATVSPLRERVAALNREGRRLCRSFSALTSKYPFSPGARGEATLNEVIRIFAPNDGELARFHSQHLDDLVVKHGSSYVATGTRPIPTTAFIDFLNQATLVSDALWPAGADGPQGPQGLRGPQGPRGPQTTFFLKMSASYAIPRVHFSLDGRRRSWTQTSTRLQRFDWYGRSAREAALAGEFAGRQESLLRFDGPWAVFKIFHRADWRRVGEVYEVSWDIPEHNIRLRGELNMAGGAAVLSPNFLQAVRCVSTVAR